VYRLRYSFFGLTPADKLLIHEQIFSLAYHSQGAFTQEIAYNLPVYLRIFYLKKLIDTKEKEKEAMEKSNKSSNKPIARPNISKGK
jgi:hypothetical protein